MVLYMNNTNLSATETTAPSQWRHSLCVAMFLTAIELAAYVVLVGCRKLVGRA